MRLMCVQALAKRLLHSAVCRGALQHNLTCERGLLHCHQFLTSKCNVLSAWQMYPASSLCSFSGMASSLQHCNPFLLSPHSAQLCGGWCEHKRVNSPRCWQLEQRRNIITEDRQTKAVTIWKDLKHIRSSPLPALVLGFSGLIPFVTPPVYMIYAQNFMPQLVFAELAYGACILSFLGGVRWGFVIPEGSQQRADWLNLGYSVVPSLVAWVGLMMPVSFGILTVMTGIAGAAYFDATMWGYPPWFRALRFILSLGAVLSLWTAYLCQYVIKEKQPKAVELPPVQTE